jgi:hypothetical protein
MFKFIRPFLALLPQNIVLTLTVKVNLPQEVLDS